MWRRTPVSVFSGRSAVPTAYSLNIPVDWSDSETLEYNVESERCWVAKKVLVGCSKLCHIVLLSELNTTKLPESAWMLMLHLHGCWCYTFRKSGNVCLSVLYRLQNYISINFGTQFDISRNWRIVCWLSKILSFEESRQEKLLQHSHFLACRNQRHVDQNLMAVKSWW